MGSRGSHRPASGHHLMASSEAGRRRPPTGVPQQVGGARPPRLRTSEEATDGGSAAGAPARGQGAAWASRSVDAAGLAGPAVVVAVVGVTRPGRIRLDRPRTRRAPGPATTRAQATGALGLAQPLAVAQGLAGDAVELAPVALGHQARLGWGTERAGLRRVQRRDRSRPGRRRRRRGLRRRGRLVTAGTTTAAAARHEAGQGEHGDSSSQACHDTTLSRFGLGSDQARTSMLGRASSRSLGRRGQLMIRFTACATATASQVWPTSFWTSHTVTSITSTNRPWPNPCRSTKPSADYERQAFLRKRVGSVGRTAKLGR